MQLVKIIYDRKKERKNLTIKKCSNFNKIRDYIKRKSISGFIFWLNSFLISRYFLKKNDNYIIVIKSKICGFNPYKKKWNINKTLFTKLDILKILNQYI